MSKIIVDISTSIDGFITGDDVSVSQPLGAGGSRLHDWFFDAKTAADEKIMSELTASSGAIILGRNMYDGGIDTGWGGVSPFVVPAYVLTTRPVPEKHVEGFHFVNDGIESVLKQAKSAAGDKNIWVIGGANVIQQFIKARLVDELRLHISPVFFGTGTALFGDIGKEHLELEKLSQSETPAATHLHYRFIK
jgi:dihydrofolate reductase